jgi:hypothetical protein
MRIVVACIACALVAGCATPAEIQRNGYDHLARAQTLQAQGDYYHAAKEREAANKQFAKARQRAADQYYYGVF